MASITVNDIDNGSTDNCGIASSVLDNDAFTCTDLGIVAVQLTVTDLNSNSAACISIVTVIDDIDPSVACQDKILVLGGLTGDATLQVSDIELSSDDNCGVVSSVLDISYFECIDEGSNLVELTVSDLSGNTGTCSATVTIEDNTSPLADCNPLSVQLDGVTGMVVVPHTSLSLASSDICGILPNTATSDFDCNDLGPNIVTITVTDNNNNSSNCSSTVTISDSSAPNVVCQDINVILDNSGMASITVNDIDNGSTDNCGIASSVLDNDAFTCTDLGIVAVQLTVTDVNSNSATCISNATVLDDIDPSVVCQDKTLVLDGLTGDATLLVSDIEVSSDDNCGVVSSVLDMSYFECIDVGSSLVELTVSDLSGNTATCSAVVSVQDNSAPDANCNDLLIELNGLSNSFTINVGDINNVSIDNCDIVNYELDQTMFDCDNLGDNFVTLTVTDDSSNSSTCSSLVTVTEIPFPVAICQDLTVDLNNSGSISIAPMDIDAGSYGGCGSIILTLDITTLTCSNTGTQVVELTVSDYEGDSATCIANVIVNDPFGACCPSDIIVNQNPVPNGVYSSSNSISSNGSISTNGVVIFKSGQLISLNPGFETLAGGLFEIILDPCSN
jgi:hypothetical protein